jgi:hypothetical protein
MRLLALALFAYSHPLSGADSLLGTWRLNIEKSEFFRNDARYKRQEFTLEVVGRQLHFHEAGIFEDGRLFDDEFTGLPGGPATKPKAPTTFTPRGESLSFEVVSDEMIWVTATDKGGKITARWMVVLDGDHLRMTQVTGGSSTRIFDRVPAPN